MYSVYEPVINHHNLFLNCKPLAIFTLEIDYPSLQNPSKLMDKQIDEVRWINRSIFTLRGIIHLMQIIKQITCVRRMVHL